ncbi:MAG: hypothetical protein K5681_07165 [Treponema sp.]|nr:hypothetical protein [Treponema sp.]
MTHLLKPEDLAKCISGLIARNKIWAGKDIFLSFIVNKTAGCFTNKKKSLGYASLFHSELEKISESPECTASITYKILSTQYSGHAQELTRGAIAEYIALDKPNSEMVIVTCGGDGTCLEVQETLYLEAHSEEKKRKAIMNNITLIRMPLGTGNDGTDGHSMPELIDILKSQLIYKNACAIKVYPERMPGDEEIEKAARDEGKNIAKYGDVNYKAPWYGFNIVSIGLDAYVVYMSNTLKKKLPGEFYHMAVPLSGLVFDKDFKMKSAKVEFFDDKGDIFAVREGPVTLLAFGASGHRVYGSGQKVLPDDNNICYTPKVGLLKIIEEGKSYAKGLHFTTGVSEPFTASKIRVSYDNAILLQNDGEVAMLTKAHFPLIIEKTEPCIRIIQKVE